jgi:energy-coupling factor transport system ATP-binding protein
VLELRGVSYRYAGYARTVIQDVDLRLADGRIMGLVGANEAGKTTTCLVASGLAPGSIGGAITGGGLFIDGEPMAGRPVHELATRVAVGFQNPATQLSGVTGSVFEEVALGPMNLGLAARETVRRTRDVLAALGIEDLAEREPRRLSGGQAQLVVIASLLAMRPAHLILDEPTAQLDPHGSSLVGRALRALAEAGTAMLVVEHKTDLLEQLCDEVAVIDGGRMVALGPAGDILGDERLPGWGVEPPSGVRIGRGLAAGGVGANRRDAALAALEAVGTETASVAPAGVRAASAGPASAVAAGAETASDGPASR